MGLLVLEIGEIFLGSGERLRERRRERRGRPSALRSYSAPLLSLLRFARSSGVRCGVRAMASTQTIPGGGMEDRGSKTKGDFSPFESQCARVLVVGGSGIDDRPVGV